MPKNVRHFAWLWWISILVDVCLIPFSPPADRDISQIWLALLGIAVIIAMLLPFYWLAVSRRKNWARWVLLIFFAATVIATLFSSSSLISNAADLTWVGSWLIEAAGFFFLFTGDARPWFNRKLPQLDVDVFL